MPFRPKIKAFLAAIRVMPNVTRAAKAAGINPAHHYAKLKSSPEYAVAFAEAFEAGCDAMSDVAIERAQIGWEEPVVYQGQPSYPEKWDKKLERFVPDYKAKPFTIWKIDNRLLEFILSRRHPAYRERKDEEAARVKADKITYQWVPRSSGASNTSPSPAKPSSTTPPPDSKDSPDQ